jgi:hypothetical protein
MALTLNQQGGGIFQDQIIINQNAPIDFRITNSVGQITTMMSAGPNLNFGRSPDFDELGAFEITPTNYFSTGVSSFWNFQTILAVRPGVNSNGASTLVCWPGSEYTTANAILEVECSDLSQWVRFHTRATGTQAETLGFVWRTGQGIDRAEPNALGVLDPQGRLRLNYDNTGPALTERLCAQAIGPRNTAQEPFNCALITVMQGQYTTDFQQIVFFATTAYSGGNTGSGSIYLQGAGGVQIVQPSDYRLKSNVRNLEHSLDRLDQLRPVSFRWINDPESDSRDHGFLAHELDLIVPQAVSGTKDAVDDEGEIVRQMADYAYLVPLLTAAAQQLAQQVRDLETTLTGTT